jgi:hypothetical protein
MTDDLSAGWREFTLQAIMQAADLAKDRIERGKFKHADARTLEANINAAKLAYTRLRHCLPQLPEDRPLVAVEAWHAVGSLAEAMYLIGGLMEISDSAADAVVRHGKRELGKVRGKQQTAKADKWREPALDYARVLRKEQPSISQAAIAEKIRTEILDFEVPQPAQVLETVRKWERDRKLDRSQKKSRVS